MFNNIVLKLLPLILLLMTSSAIADTSLEKIRENGTSHLHKSEYDIAFNFFKTGLEIARSKKKSWYETVFLNDLGCVYQYTGKLDSATITFDRALEIAKKENYTLIVAHTKRNLSNIYSLKSQYTKASAYLYEAAQIYASHGQRNDLATAYNTIGNIQFGIGTYRQALHFFKKAQQIYEQIKTELERNDSDTYDTEIDLAIVLNNIGECYIKLNTTDSAIIYLQRSLKLKQKLEIPLYEANTLNMLAEVYHHVLKNFALAHTYYTQAYEIRLKHTDSNAIANSTASMASLFYDLGDYKRAETLSATAEKLSLKDSLKTELLKIYNIRRNIYRRLNQPLRALFYDSIYISLYEDLKETEQARMITDLHLRFDTQLKDKQIQVYKMQKEIDNEEKELQNQRTYGIIILCVLIVVVMIFAYAQKRRSKRRLEVMMRELNHRVKNNFQQLSSLLSLYRMQLNDEEARKAITETSSRVHAMSLVHRKLYLDTESLTTVKLDEFIKELTYELMAGYGYDGNTIRLHFDMDQISMDADKAVPVSLIANELITNAFKYGMSNERKPSLTIDLVQSHKRIILTVTDNGPGINTEFVTGNSFGTRLISLLSKQLNASVRHQSEKGLKVQVIIPQAS